MYSDRIFLRCVELENISNRKKVRKRSIRGPWRYEERILQLGYKPSHQQRRNSLPVQALTTQQPRDLQRIAFNNFKFFNYP